MQKDKIGFLILHYYAMEETINCINSIKEKIDTDNYEIVVVDNCSPNGSGSKLKKKYQKDLKVTVILNKENLGFAKGNNVGFEYLKNTSECNYIVMLNNDVLLLSNDIFKQVKQEFKKNSFAVMGPKIYDINDNLAYFNQNFTTIKKLKKDIITLYILLFLAHCHLLSLIYKLMKKDKQININRENNVNDGVRKEDVLLHGCCLIFSPLYVKKFNGIDDRTFLYREEEFLYLRLKNNKMKSIYNPNIAIKHLEDIATNKSTSNFNTRKKRMYKSQLKSTKLLLNELKKER